MHGNLIQSRAPGSNDSGAFLQSQSPRSAGWRFIAVLVVLGVATAAAFWPVLHCGLSGIDDGAFLDPPAVRAGLTADSVEWAFTNTAAGHYLPITWLSFVAQKTLVGLSPAASHAVNLWLHVLCALTLLLTLYAATRRLWPSALTAAIFALHPLRVEAVAWIAERDHLLAAWFGLLCLLSYVCYGKWRRWYGLLGCYLFFVLSVLAKPMLVTLAPVLMLLDLWPLRRWPASAALPGRSTGVATLILEKIPILLAGAAVAVVSVLLQSDHDTTGGLRVPSSDARLANAIRNCIVYVADLCHVVNLSVIYPFGAPGAAWQVAGAAALTLAITLACLAQWRRRPWLVVGWGSYLLLIVPMLGLSPFGVPVQKADRYSYFPHIALLVGIVWSIPPRWFESRRGRMTGAALSTALIVALALLSARQCRFWTSPTTLFSHAYAWSADSGMVDEALGAALSEAGETGRGIELLKRATMLEPDYALAHYNLGLALARIGNKAQAIGEYEAAIRLRPASVEAHTNLGSCLFEQGRDEQAIAQYRLALRDDPRHLAALCGIGNVLCRHGDFAGAASYYRKCLAIDPSYAPARANLAQCGGR